MRAAFASESQNMTEGENVMPLDSQMEVGEYLKYNSGMQRERMKWMEQTRFYVFNTWFNCEERRIYCAKQWQGILLNVYGDIVFKVIRGSLCERFYFPNQININ